jgi:hypothetical protein
MSSVSRKILFTAGETFVRRIVRVRGVVRVALVGSMTTDKPNPKDIDFLLTVSDEFDIAEAATVGRKLKGCLVGHNSGADIFLCDTNHRYIGRTCNYRECHRRVACEGETCRPGSWLNTDFHLVKLAPTLCENPPVIIWPFQQTAESVPADVLKMLANLRDLCG